MSQYFANIVEKGLLNTVGGLSGTERVYIVSEEWRLNG